MARETKVGLLAGLGFIVCFALILANRGQLDSQSRDRTFLTKTDKPANSQNRYARRPSRRSNSRPSSPDRASRAIPATRRTQRPPMRVDVPQLAQQGQTVRQQSRISGPTGGQQQLPERVQSPVSRRNVTTREKSLRNDATGFSSLTSPVMPNAATSSRVLENRRIIQRPKHTINQGATDTSSRNRSVDGLIRYAAGKIVPASRRSTFPARSHATYQVKSGDTLYKIAARELGKSSRRNVDAIFDANRSTLSSPDQLKVGMKIVIPAASTISTQVKSLRRVLSPLQKTVIQQRGTRATPTRRSPKFRWYQIKKNDRYINIARNELGDAKRWHEIHDLNKRNFPDPDKIRAGVRIKLPLSSAVASSESGR